MNDICYMTNQKKNKALFFLNSDLCWLKVSTSLAYSLLLTKRLNQFGKKSTNCTIYFNVSVQNGQTITLMHPSKKHKNTKKEGKSCHNINIPIVTHQGADFCHV